MTGGRFLPSQTCCWWIGGQVDSECNTGAIGLGTHTGAKRNGSQCS